MAGTCLFYKLVYRCTAAG